MKELTHEGVTYYAWEFPDRSWVECDFCDLNGDQRITGCKQAHCSPSQRESGNPAVFLTLKNYTKAKLKGGV